MAGNKGLSIIKPVTQYLDLVTHTIIKFNWPVPSKEKAKILLIHGLGEHIGRYNNIAKLLYQAGYSVIAYDQYGHGISTGSRGDIDCENRLTEDLKMIISTIETRLPIVLFGHSLGGLVVQRVLAENPKLVDAAVISSPAFAVYTSWIDKLLIFTLSNWFAHIKVDNKLAINWLCRDAQTVREYIADPLVHRNITIGLAAWIVKQGEKARKRLDDWHVPTLLMYAGQDRLVDPIGSEQFAKKTSQQFVQSICFNVMYHEIFNDPEKHLVVNKMIDWLDNRYATTVEDSQ